jgi:hypothetical protein
MCAVHPIGAVAGCYRWPRERKRKQAGDNNSRFPRRAGNRGPHRGDGKSICRGRGAYNLLEVARAISRLPDLWEPTDAENPKPLHATDWREVRARS